MSSQAEVGQVIDTYFDALFRGDVERLRSTFHPRAILSGEVKGAPYYKTVDEYLSAVRNRQSPQALGEILRMKAVSFDIVGPIAFVKTQSPMLGFNYIDFLSLVRHEGRWVIAAKVFTHVG
jgi:Putative lumazine-binding